MKRGRKPGFKLRWNSSYYDTWYQDFRNLIHYARYYGNLSEIRLENLEKEREKERGWMNEKAYELESMQLVRQIIATTWQPDSSLEQSRLLDSVDDVIKEREKRHKDSQHWFTFLNLCIEEYKKWERVSNGGSIQQQASS